MALKNRNVYTLPTLPTLGAANYQFTDPIFGSRITRVTDENTTADLGQTNYSCSTPDGSFQSMWNANCTRMWMTVPPNGAPILFQWDPSTRLGSRRTPILNFSRDLSFHDTNPDYIYGESVAAGATNNHTIVRADVSTTPYTYSILFNCDTFVAGLAARGTTYTGSISVANNTVMTICGGTGQGLHDFVIWYPIGNPAGAKTLDTLNRVGMDHFTMHSACMDKSGRFIGLIPLLNDQLRCYIWDTTLDTVTGMTPIVDNHGTGGHECYGYGNRLNNDYITDYDNVQMILTPALTAPNINQRELIVPILSPTETYVGTHVSWNNAQAATLVPAIMETQRVNDGPLDDHTGTIAWRMCDNEIVSFSTDTGPCVLYRHCHHRSDYYREATYPSADIFRYTPRVNISPDGKWAAFTSTWGFSLGWEGGGSTIRRGDVFIVECLYDSGRAYRHSRRLR